MVKLISLYIVSLKVAESMGDVKWGLVIVGSLFHSWRCLKKNLRLTLVIHSNFHCFLSIWKFLPRSVLQPHVCSVSLFSTVLSLLRLSALSPFIVRKEWGIRKNKLSNTESRHLLTKYWAFTFFRLLRNRSSCPGLRASGPWDFLALGMSKSWNLKKAVISLHYVFYVSKRGSG